MLPEIELQPSKNHNDRPKGVNGIVIHSAAAVIGGKPAPEFMAENRLSYHSMIEPSGKIINTVDFENRAWHAGKSCLADETNLNDNFIGICLMVNAPGGWAGFLSAIKDPDSFTGGHYDSALFLCRYLMWKYPAITRNRIVKHSEVSSADVRPDPKPDPGAGFDMGRLKTAIQVKQTGTI